MFGAGGPFVGSSGGGVPSRVVGPNGSISATSSGVLITDTTSGGPSPGIQITENGANGMRLLDNGVGGIEIESVNGPIVLIGTSTQVVIPSADPHIAGALYSLAGVVHVSAG